jgi:hypothetical protein
VAKNLMIGTPARNRLSAARGMLSDYSRSRPQDEAAWATRLAGALSSVVGVAEEALALNSEMADIMEKILIP